MATPPERSTWWLRGWTAGRALPTAAGVALGLLAAQGIAAMFAELRGLLAVLVVSLFLSFALEPAVQSLARRGMRRGVATALVFVAGLAAVVGFIAVVTGLVAAQVTSLVAAGPTLVDEVLARAVRGLPAGLGEALTAWADERRRLLPMDGAALGDAAVGLGQSLLGGIVRAATIALVTFYLVADGPRLRAWLARRLPPAQQVRVLGAWELAIAKTGGYVYSRVLTALISSAFHLVVFTVVDLDYAVALALWVGVVSSLIPAVGTYLAGALPLVVALASDARTALVTLVAIVAYQQVENYVIVPRVTATTLQLHPAVAFLSVVGGAALAGATGALLAIPAVAIVAALASSVGAEHEVLVHHLVETGTPPPEPDDPAAPV